jgi:hypothetical protein
MSGQWDAVSLVCGAAIGAIAVGAVGLRSGADMAAEAARIVDACAAQCEADDVGARVACDAAHEQSSAALERHVMALRDLADRCVLSLPSRERLRVERVRRAPLIDAWRDPPMDGPPDAD